MARRDYAGSARSALTTTGSLSPTGLSVDCDNLTGWPTGGANGEFAVVFGRGLASEEHALGASRSGNTITFASAAKRGIDDTTAGTWPAGTSIEHGVLALDTDEPNAHINDTGLDHHTQYHNTTRHAAVVHTQAMMGTDSIGSAQIQANAIGTSELADNAVDTAAIAALAVTAAKIAANTITAAELAPDSVTSSELANDSVDSAAIADDAIDTITYFQTGIRPVQASATAPATDLKTGDIWVDTDAPNLLYVRTAAGAWVAQSFQLLASSTVSGAAAQQVTFSSIPAEFDHLRLVYWARSDVGTDALRNIGLRFNGDTGNNYHFRVVENGVFTQTLSTDNIQINKIDGTNAGFDSQGTVDILNYRATTDFISAISHGFNEQTAMIQQADSRGTWNTPAAITSVAIRTNVTTTKFAIGSKFWLYGV